MSWRSATIRGTLWGDGPDQASRHDEEVVGVTSETNDRDVPRSDDRGDATSESRDTAPSEDAKAKFREALDRKNRASHRTVDGERNTGAVHGSETTGPVQKMFRRKSG